MPVYVYKCKECDSKFEVFQKSINSEEEHSCPKCESVNVNKLISSGSFTGFSSSSLPTQSSCASGMCGLN